MWCGCRIQVPTAATAVDLGREASCADPASSAAPDAHLST
jgi:hypothetical protein